ncbi:MAG: hypothetical protein A2X16_00425 [Bacteroidetes bacterium GWF2_39_10]|nr:MAG: hypothetical protein A2X16_00425 [Bacteroidetes bacterium GWF2_39_10]
MLGLLVEFAGFGSFYGVVKNGWVFAGELPGVKEEGPVNIGDKLFDINIFDCVNTGFCGRGRTVIRKIV